MPLTIVPEDGSGLTNANAFQATSAVTTILEGHPFASAWTAAAATQDAINVEATSILCNLYWDGVAASEAQALAFPRCGLVTRDGYTVADDVVPTFVLQAHARTCLYLAQQAADPFSDTGLAQGSEIVVGPIRLTPASSTTLPPAVRALVAPYVRSSSSMVRA